ncbi:DNA fragmentation factor subunit alpha-like [Dendronephthya gigantea]|uniref:DNA fragmentation factor subunit alpha-like n=1 Tax=Dendronephthya gigantea TaxID=151771 RepID=UPI00106CC6AC|nr:DNA fragmentation factor subunit alpha-like [Dendronephthya gigantea]
MEIKISSEGNERGLQRSRPFKICDSSRERKKGIVCSTLQELRSISCEQFMLQPDCRVFLESDGTEVVCDEYFQFLPPQTLFMVTASNGKWVKTRSEDIHYVEGIAHSDSEQQESYHGLDECDGPVRLPLSIKKRILDDPAMFCFSLSTEELEKIRELGLETLKDEINCPVKEVRLIFDNCEQELNRRKDIEQTRELLNICQKALNKSRQNRESPEEPSKKLKR